MRKWKTAVKNNFGGVNRGNIGKNLKSNAR